MAGFLKKVFNKVAGIDENEEWDENEMYDSEEMSDYETESFDSYREADTDYVEQPRVEVVDTQMSARSYPIKSVQSSSNQVVILQPDSIRSSQAVCDNIREGHTVICNIENVDRNVAQRVIDYISGAAYSIDGNVKPIDQNRKTFVVAPRNVSLMDRDALAKQAEAQNQQQAYRQVL